MKKLLLFASLALTTAVSAWGYGQDPGTAMQISVNMTTGERYRGGAVSTENWCSWWKSKLPENTADMTHPQVTFGVVGSANNLGKSGDNLIIAAGSAKSATYLATAENSDWYVSKITFDCVAAADGAKIFVGSDAFMLTTTDNHFEHEYAYDEDASFRLTGSNAQITTSNFVITIKKMDRGEVTERAIKKYSFEQYPTLWSVEKAEAVNTALAEAAEAYTLENETDLTPLNTYLRDLADEKLRTELLPEVDGKFVKFQDRQTERFIAAFKAGETDGETEITADCSRMTTNGDDMHAIWRLAYDETAQLIRFHHYATDLDLGNNNANNTALPVYDHSDIDQGADAKGALFTMRPVRIKSGDEILYIVELEDNTDADSRHFIHDNTLFSSPIKWNAAETSPGSGWYVTVLDIHPDGEMAGLLALDSENKDVVIYNSTTNQYLSLVGENSIGYIDELRPSAIWKIDVEEEDHNNGEIVIKHMLTGKYANSLSGELSTKSTPTLKVVNYVDEHATWHLVSRTLDAVPEDAPRFNINEITFEQKAQMITDLTNFMIYEIGNEPGQFSYNDEEKDNRYVELKNGIEAINGEDSFDFVTANEIFNLEAPSIFDLNALEGPALVQIKTHAINTTTPNTYLTNSNSGSVVNSDMEQNANENINNVFVLHEGKICSLVDGKYLVTNEALVTPYIWNSDNADDNEGLAMNFIDGSVNGLGSYYLNFGTDADGKRYYLHCGDAGAVSCGSAAESDGYEALLEKQSNKLGYHFAVEYVKTLAVSVEENGLKLWRTPVTINFGDNDNNGAYVVKVTDTKITTTKAEASTNYGAGTIFVLTQDINVNVVNGSALEAPVAGLGHHAVKNHEVTPDKAYLTIHEDQTGDVQTASDLYYDGAEDAPSVRLLVKMYDTNDNVKLDAHTPVIAVAKNENTELTDGGSLTLPLGGSAETTQISEVIVGASAPAAIYDLQGRKLAAPAKGINIINGRKHLVK